MHRTQLHCRCVFSGRYRDVGREGNSPAHTTTFHMTAQTLCMLDNETHISSHFLGLIFAPVQMPCKAISAEYYFCDLDCLRGTVQAVAHCTESSAPSIFVCRCLPF